MSANGSATPPGADEKARIQRRSTTSGARLRPFIPVPGNHEYLCYRDLREQIELTNWTRHGCPSIMTSYLCDISAVFAQRKWIHDRNDKCGTDVDCLRSEFKDRIPAAQIAHSNHKYTEGNGPWKPDEYIAKRVERPDGWYDRREQDRAALVKAIAWRTRLCHRHSLIAGFTIPRKQPPLVVGVLGSMIRVSAVLLAWVVQENWVDYRTQANP